jgi:SSS family solute:Na+ symporter
VPAIFGAPIWLGFIWRRLTKRAVILQVAACLTIYALVPTLFSTLDWATHRPAFLAETATRTVLVTISATSDDVVRGRAAAVGQRREERREMPPVAVFFDRVARVDPASADSPKVGLGRFNAEIWVLALLGADFSHFSKPGLLATRFFFDALFPFVLLIGLSYVTAPAPRRLLDRFFVRLHTPVQPTSDAEQAELEAGYANPDRWEPDKLFPGTHWEILKPAASDYVGFFGTCGLVGVVIALLWLMVTLQ